jgi:Sec-independent protein translocase protein TatA
MAQPTDPSAPAPKKSPVVIIVIVLVVLFVVGTCFLGILATLLMPALMKAKNRANEVKCANNLKQIGLAAMQYADDKRFFPHDPSDPTGKKAMELLRRGNYIDNDQVFGCPNDDDPAEISYEGFPVLVELKLSRSDRPLAWDRKPHPGRAGRPTRIVVFADCHTEQVDEDLMPQILERASATTGK